MASVRLGISDRNKAWLTIKVATVTGSSLTGGRMTNHILSLGSLSCGLVA